MIEAFKEEHKEYLRDESRKAGEAQFISFPQTHEEVRKVMKSACGTNQCVTVQGARTGITAGAVPNGGYVLNLSRMNEITGLKPGANINECFLTVQPGVLLTEIRKALADTQYFFPPDPTEASASIGGMASCNASGACSYYYGPTRNYIEALQIILADGSGIHLRRREHNASNCFFKLKTDSGSLLEGELPGYAMPDIKNASGYFARDDMDMVDLFIGSEGTLGVITDIELRLLKKPEAIWGIMAFFPSEESGVKFVQTLREEMKAVVNGSGDSRLVAIEYFNHNALNLLRKQKKENRSFSGIPHIPLEYHTAIYVEFHGDNDDSVSDMVMEAVEYLITCGGSDETSWIAMNPNELEKLKYFRHAVPEAVNLEIDQRRKTNPGISKLSTDMAVPDDYLEKTLLMYNTALAGLDLDSVMFGHIGNNHIHVNILPKDMEDYEKGKKLYLDWAREVIRVGGTISAEHGVGKLKKELLREMFGDQGIKQMQAVKRIFDPDCNLNKGTLFDCIPIDKSG